MGKTFKPFKRVPKDFNRENLPKTCQVISADGSVCGKKAVAAMAYADFTEPTGICMEHAKIIYPENFGLSREDVAMHPDIKYED
jgi:hypothetical protein